MLYSTIKELSLRAVTRLKRDLGEMTFAPHARGILDTPPLCMNGASPVFLSMLCHRDVVSWLLAIKSLYLEIGEGRAAVINDGTLTDTDFALIQHHVPALSIIPLAKVDTGSCPRGGCWERLVKIIRLSADSYVIQLDADTLTMDSIPEVAQSWRENRSFLLGTDSGKAVMSATEVAEMVRRWIASHRWKQPQLGVEAEAALDRLPEAATLSYVHASAGFSGFAKGAFHMADLENFSSQMTELVGEHRWKNWGSEQIASNFMLANAPGARVLPFPDYACFDPNLPKGTYRFLHFIGSYRYNGGVYRRAARAFVREML